MHTVTMEAGQIVVAPARGRQRVSVPLSSLRLIYLFLPKHFHWHFILPSETEYRFLNLDALQLPDLEVLRAQLAVLPERAMGDFIFLLKDTGGQVIKLTLRDFHTAGIDFVQACIDTREQRQAHCSAWLEGGPQALFNHLVFDRQGVQQGSKRTPWTALDRVEVRTVESLGTTSYFHFHPVTGSGCKKFFQGMHPQKIEECLAEIDFWRSQCLPQGSPVEESRAVFDRPSQAQPNPAGRAKRLLWMALLTALLFGLLACALIFSTRPAGAQQASAGGEAWQAYPLSGGEMTAITADPFSAQVVFVGTRDAGVYQTRDAGLTWRPARAGLSYAPIRTLLADPIHPGILYAGTDYDGVWKTTDGGASWVSASSGLDKSLIVFGLVFDPQNPSTLYAGLAGGVGLVSGNIYRSLDGGAAWQMMDQGIRRESNSQHTNGIFALAADPSHPGWLYAGTNFRGVYRSINGGATWAAVNGGLPQRPEQPGYYQPVNALAFDQHHNHRLVGIVGGEYYAFENGAWRKVSTGSADCNSAIGADRLYVHPTQPKTLYSTGSTLKISLDGGLTWTQSLGWDDSGNISQLAFHPSTPDVIYAASDILMKYEGGVWKTTDQGEHWSQAWSGITAQPVRSVAVDPTNPQRIYAGTGSSGFFYRSEDGGSTWSRGYEPGWTQGEEKYDFGEVVDIAVDPMNPQKIYMSAGDFYISTDTGVTFSKIAAVHNPGSITLPEGAPGVIYVGSKFTGYGVYKSVDGGMTWTQKNTGIPIFGSSLTPILSLAVDPSVPNTLWAGTQYGEGLVKTVDGGEHWVSKGLKEANFIEAIAVHPTQPDTLLVGAGYSDGRIYRTTDGSNTWQTVLQGVGFVQELLYDPRDPNWVYAITEGYGVLRSSDGGKIWFDYNPGIFYPLMYAADFTGGPSPRLIAGSYGSGLYWIDPDISKALHRNVYMPMIVH